MLKFLLKLFAVLSALYLIYIFAVTRIRFPKDASAIGIIGGADGPTAIFVSGEPTLLARFLIKLNTIIKR